MKKLLAILLFLVFLAPCFAYESSLLSASEKVAADSIHVTSADIINVAKADSFPDLFYLAVFFILAYCILFYFKLKTKLFRKSKKTLNFYSRFNPHIARICAGLIFIWFAFQESLFQTNSFVRILLGIIGFLVIAGLFQRYVSAGAIFLLIWVVAKKLIPVHHSLELFGLLLILFNISKNPLSLDSLFNIKTKQLKSFEEKSYSLIRIIVGLSLMINGYLTIYSPNYSLMLFSKIQYLSSLTLNPETLIFGAGAVLMLIGFMLFIGFFTRFHSALALLISVLLFFSVTPEGLIILPLLGCSMILITAKQFLSIDQIIK